MPKRTLKDPPRLVMVLLLLPLLGLLEVVTQPLPIFMK